MKRIISLFDRAVKKFKKDWPLIREYFKFCIQIKSPKLLYNVFLRNLKHFTHSLLYWMVLISFEFHQRRNIFKARELFDKALTMNKTNIEFWIQYLYFEIEFHQFVQRREKYVDKLLREENREESPKEKEDDVEELEVIELESEEESLEGGMLETQDSVQLICIVLKQLEDLLGKQEHDQK